MDRLADARVAWEPLLGSAFFISLTPMLCYRVEPDGSRGFIEVVNRAFIEKYGYSDDALKKMTVNDLDAPEVRSAVPPLSTRFRAAKSRSFETIHLMASGARVAVEVRAGLLETEAGRFVVAGMQPREDYVPSEEGKNGRERICSGVRELEELNADLIQKDMELRRREAQFDTARELGGIGSWSVNLETGEKYWSDEVYNITGFDKGSGPVGKDELIRLVHESDRDMVEKSFLNCIRNGHGMDVRFGMTGYDGVERHVQVRALMEHDSKDHGVWMHGFVRDVSDDYRRAARARSSEDMFRSLFLSSSSVMMLIDPDTGTIVRPNAAACRFYGYSRNELIGKPIGEINMLSDETLGERISQASAEQKRRFHFQHRLANGEIREVDVFSGPVNVLGKRLLYSIVIDMTEERRAEEELKRARNEAVQANKAKSEFLANMSHEIRTPLNGVLGMLQLLRQTVRQAEEIEYVDTALDSGRNLLRLISDILDLCKVEAGRMSVESNRFNPRELVKGSTDLFRREAQDKNLSLRFRPSGPMPEWVLGDEVRVRQILFNLIGNAVKFTHVGGISVDAGMVQDAKGPLLWVSVKDTGIGMRPWEVPKVFETFTQADGSFTRTYQGSGLGLSIVRRLVQLMDGTLTVDTEEGAGTTVVFTVRLKVNDPEKDAAAGNRPRKKTARNARKVLLVEDERVNRLTARRMLEKEGHAVLCAENGKEALDILNADPEVDCVLMDVQMPVMDGVEALRRIREGRTAASSEIPIIALTAHAMAGDRERLLGEGMNDYLSKPVGAMELVRAVDAVMAK